MLAKKKNSKKITEAENNIIIEVAQEPNRELLIAATTQKMNKVN